jgi:hypothetical protein
MKRIARMLSLSILTAACGGDSPTGPVLSSGLVGTWFSSGQYGEHTLLLYENAKWVDLAVYLVPGIDFDPYTIDPVLMAESEYDGGTYSVAGDQISFAYWGDDHQETFELSTEGFSTPVRDDDLLIIGSRPYLFNDTLPGTVADPVPLSNVAVHVAGQERTYRLNVYSTESSHIESDSFGFSPLVLLLKSMGGSELEISVADLSLITVGQQLPVDGSALGIGASLDDWESLWWAGGDRPEGTITFTRLEDSSPGKAVASGRIAGLRLWDYDVEGRSVMVNATFQDVELTIE